jgi:hypothetical protein
MFTHVAEPSIASYYGVMWPVGPWQGVAFTADDLAQALDMAFYEGAAEILVRYRTPDSHIYYLISATSWEQRKGTRVENHAWQHLLPDHADPQPPHRLQRGRAGCCARCYRG